MKIGSCWDIGRNIMEHVYIIDLDMNTIFSEKLVQAYLDTYLYIRSESIGTEVVESNNNVTGKALVQNWSK
jgi:hypothetical protein